MSGDGSGNSSGKKKKKKGGDPVVTVRGTVTRIHHSSARFTAGRLQPVDGEAPEISFAGPAFCCRVGELVTLAGRWVEHPKYGRQVQTTERIFDDGGDGDTPTDPVTTVDALAAWLAANGAGHGVGPARARRIAEAVAGDVGQLRDDPARVATLAGGVTREAVEALAALWEDDRGFNAAGLKLARYELTLNQIHALWGRFKGGLLPLLDEDPYLLVREVPGFGFRRVDAIARKLGVPELHPGRVAAALRHVVASAESDDGSTCVPLDEAAAGAASLLVDAAAAAAEGSSSSAIVAVVDEHVRAAADRLVAAGELSSLTSSQGDVHLSTPWAMRHESAFLGYVRERSAEAQGRNPHFAHLSDGELRDLAWRHGPTLDASQRDAVLMALRHRVCLVTGGAGAGKTTIVRALVACYRALDLSVELCAPTGKAARRLEEAVPGCEARTIHRLLEWHSLEGFRRNVGKPLSCAAVVCDETSMVGSRLMHDLIDALAGSKNTCLVLVGDHHQLPPVDAGAVLRDCVAHRLVPTAVLTRCHRQAGVLRESCQAVLAGEVRPTGAAGDGGGWYVASHLHTPDAVLAYIERLFTSVVPGRLGFTDVLRDAQFLSPTHKGPLGTRAINALLQRLHQRSAFGVEVPIPPGDDQEGGRRPLLRVGDKVIQTRNNYELDVMNGHQGVVVSAARPGPLVVRFFDGGGDRAVAIPKDREGDVELAYCLSVHKMQGSQVPCALVVVHRSHQFMTHRNWLYTAVTRAQKAVVLLGDPDGISRAASRVVSDRRRTLLPLLAATAAGACVTEDT